VCLGSLAGGNRLLSPRHADMGMLFSAQWGGGVVHGLLYFPGDMELVQWTDCLCGDGHAFCGGIELSFLALQALCRTSYRLPFQKAVPSEGVSYRVQ
jgi:hypothetical protein